MKYILQNLILALLFIPFIGISQDREQLKEEIDKVIYFETEISHDNIPGFTIGIIFEDSTFIYNYGKESKNSEIPLDGNSLFEIGSITKVFTSSLVSILVKEELLSYDSTFNSYLDPKHRNDQLDEITIRKLVNHTSGLPRMPVDFGTHEKVLNNPYAHYTQSQLIDFYKSYKLIPRGKKDPEYLYSNVNYGLLEIAIEKVCGKEYEEVLKEKVLVPAGMENTFTSRNQSEKELITGYSRSGKAVGPWKFQSFTASEGLKSNANDLITFLQLHLQLKETPYDSLFNDNCSRKVNTGLSDNAFMGNGWHIIQLKKYYDVILHSGSTGGHRAFIGFVKETKTGVVILSNSENGTGGLGYLILRLVNFNWKKK